MSDSEARAVLTVNAVEQVLAEQIRPALSAHVGSVELTRVDDGGLVHLRLVGSCARCYFRRACAVNLVRPTLEAELGAIDVRVDNARVG